MRLCHTHTQRTQLIYYDMYKLVEYTSIANVHVSRYINKQTHKQDKWFRSIIRNNIANIVWELFASFSFRVIAL